jgi:apolipoprotein N-acyltransferase
VGSLLAKGMDKEMKDLFKKIKPFLVFFFALAAGAMLPFAFAPYNFGIAALISPGILLWCLAKRSLPKSFVIGFAYGIAMFGVGVNWVYVSIHDYGNTGPMLASIITGLFVLLMALYPAIMGVVLNKFFNKNEIIRTLLIFPALWTVFEIIRGWMLTGFPWLFVGYTQMSSQLRSFAPIGGVWAVTWAAVFISSLLYLIIDYYYTNKAYPKYRNKLFAGMFIIWAIAFGCRQITWTVPTDEKLTVSLVQGNVAQLMRWDPAHVSNIVNTYRTLTQQALASNIIVWPEGAVPIPLPLSMPLFKEMSEIAKANNVALISGVPALLADQEHYYNALLAVGVAGAKNEGCDNYENPGCIYYKEHLVPFGEFVPFEKVLRGLIGFFNIPMSSFVSGPSNQGPLVAHEYRFAPAICYEIAYPLYVQQISKNADFILTVSNDTWFGESIGPVQHLQIAQFRALENGKYVIRATNTGFTAIIEPDRRIQAIATAFEANVLTGTVYKMQGQTPWTRFGVWPLAVALFCALVGGYFWQSYKPKKKK